ncbi:MAG: acyl-CoA thioesterase [Williamsia sp.]|nr:acyl-CoA thioesterase [Williamsia sp.]
MPQFIPDFPSSFLFTTQIPIRITDLNYGGHVGNDRVLSLIHEARVQYLEKLELSELQFGGTGLILKQVSIDFTKELFYGNQLQVSVKAGEFTSVAFALFYKLELLKDENWVTAALAKTTMVCYDYEKKKLSQLTEEIKEKLI